MLVLVLFRIALSFSYTFFIPFIFFSDLFSIFLFVSPEFSIQLSKISLYFSPTYFQFFYLFLLNFQSNYRKFHFFNNAGISFRLIKSLIPLSTVSKLFLKYSLLDESISISVWNLTKSNLRYLFFYSLFIVKLCDYRN